MQRRAGINGEIKDHTAQGRGLCVACIRDSSCTYPRLQPVVQCEEFEGYEPRSLALPASAPVCEDPAPAGAFENKGLCITCENRYTCGFPKPAGGIWHCEEFR